MYLFQDQLDFASRDIQEERRERLRMREQLSIQNEIINKLYTRLNQVCWVEQFTVIFRQSQY